MDDPFQWLELYTSIATITILYIEWSRKKKGLIEKTTGKGYEASHTTHAKT